MDSEHNPVLLTRRVLRSEYFARQELLSKARTAISNGQKINDKRAPA